MNEFLLQTAFGVIGIELSDEEMEKSYKLSELEDALAPQAFGMSLEQYKEARKLRRIRDAMHNCEVQCSGTNREGKRCKNRIQLEDAYRDPRTIVQEFSAEHFCQWHG
jgi:hypothetical protein